MVYKEMPDCNGYLAKAYSKGSDFYFPYIEHKQVIESLKAVPYLGLEEVIKLM